MTIFKKLLLVILLCTVSQTMAMKRLDGIVAVVGDSIILDSELNGYVFLKISQLGKKPDMLAMNILKKESLQELIDGKVLIVKAEKDSNIVVTSNEIENEVENRIQYILKQNNIDITQFEEVLKKQQGMGLIKFKSELRKQIKQELIKQKVQQLYADPGNISRSDVESFFNEFKDSIPPAGESVLLKKIVLENLPSKEVKEKAYSKILAIKSKLDDGEDFSEVAKKFSDGPNAVNGGDLGFISKGTLDLLTFEERAFRMKQGEISEPFETKLGFHILHCLEKKDQQVHIQQIFVKVEPSKSVIEKNNALIDSIRTFAKTDADFIDCVKKFSVDEVSKSRNGLLPWQEINKLSPEIKNLVDNLDIGEISKPLKQENKISIFRLVERKKSRPLSLEEDWPEISSLAHRVIAQRKLQDLVAKWRKEVYIEEKL